MNVLILDNYDSFTYNLYQYIGEILQRRYTQFQLDVIRNDKISVSQIRSKNYERIVISPGPGDPSDHAYFGVCSDVLLTIGKKIPVLGVCLGMQGMAHYFGGRVIRAEYPMHGKTSVISHDAKGIFTGLPQHLSVMRYHSLVADATTLPECLQITAVVEMGDRSSLVDVRQDGVEIMGLRHRQYPIEGIQFHPESFATEAGMMMLEQFIIQKKHI